MFEGISIRAGYTKNVISTKKGALFGHATALKKDTFVNLFL
jgi:hypothetical protein